MQYKKDALHESILKEAEQEFFDKGYLSASLRQIAKRSGTTIGNLYHYFDSKEALFNELVKNEHEAFIYMLNNHYDNEFEFDARGSADLRVWKGFLRAFLSELKPIFTNRFLIMLDRSAGTNYENTKNEFVKFVSAHYLEHIEDTSTATFSPEFVELISRQLIDGIMNVIRSVPDEKQRLDMMTDLFLFYIIGFLGMTMQTS